MVVSTILTAVLVLSAYGGTQTAGKVFKLGISEDLTTTNFWQANGPDNTVWNAYVQLPMRIALYILSDQTNQIVLQAADLAKA